MLAQLEQADPPIRLAPFTREALALWAGTPFFASVPQHAEIIVWQQSFGSPISTGRIDWLLQVAARRSPSNLHSNHHATRRFVSFYSASHPFVAVDTLHLLRALDDNQVPCRLDILLSSSVRIIFHLIRFYSSLGTTRDNGDRCPCVRLPPESCRFRQHHPTD